MKKLFLLVAFTGIVAAASANTFLALSKSTVIVLGDDKKGDDKKGDDKKKDGKSCCKKDGGKSCCKKGDSKATGETKPASDSKTNSTPPAKK